MKKGVIVFIISIFIFSFANLVFAGLGGSCTIMPIASGCTGGEFVDMLYFSHANNAHACLWLLKYLTAHVTQ